MSEAVNKVRELMRLPQHLCNMCGKCCKIAIFKGGLTYKEVVALANSTDADPTQIEGAKDFLSIFVPYETPEDAKKANSPFVQRTLEQLKKTEEEITFFYCQYINEKNMCMIHEDRPLLCRMYPIPHERTLYNLDCGFEEQGLKNWNEIKQIINALEEKKESLEKSE